jgi:hypothetical protein
MLGEEVRSVKVEVLTIDRSCVKISDGDCPTMLVVRKASNDICPEEMDVASTGARESRLATLGEGAQDEQHVAAAVEAPSLSESPTRASSAPIGTDSDETRTTVDYQGPVFEVMSAHSVSEENTPPPSQLYGLQRAEVTVASGHLRSDLILQIEQAVGNIEPTSNSRRTRDASSSGSATPPIVWGRQR